MKKPNILFIMSLLFLPMIATAQEETSSVSSLFDFSTTELVLAFAVVVALVCVIAMYTILVVMKTLIKLQKGELPAEATPTPLIAEQPGEEGAPFWRKFWNRINASVPVAREAEVATSHEYDGIRELDNRLPPWWLYGFYASIVFAVIYLARFYFFEMPTQDQEFHAEMQDADEQVMAYLASLDNLIDENSVTLSLETADINAGKAIFNANCSVCHAADGGGGVGPNLTDKYWLHGGDMKAIFKTIKYGVPSKGMIAWETQLSPKKMQQVSSYIYAMEGTESLKPKAAQGELFERVEITDDSQQDDESSEEIAEIEE